MIFRCFFVITRCVSVSSQYFAASSRCVAMISWLVLLWALIVFRFELTFCFREFSVFFLITRCVSVISRYIVVSTRSISLCFYFPWIVVVLYIVYLNVLVPFQNCLRWLPRVFTSNPSCIAGVTERNLVTLSLRFCSRASPLRLPIWESSFIKFHFLD